MVTPPYRRTALGAALGLGAALAACANLTGPGKGACDPNAQFSLAAFQSAVSIQRPNAGVIDVIVNRTGYDGPLNFSVERGIRQYGTDEFLTSRGVLFYTFQPNPVPEDGGVTRLEFHGEPGFPAFSGLKVYVRAFRGSGETAKECFGELTLSMQ